MVEAGLVLSRFLHYGASLILFGASLFPLYTYCRRAGEARARANRFQQVTVSAAAFAALLTGVLWFICVAASMTGTPSGAADPEALWSVLSETSFGYVWILRLVLITIFIGLTALRGASDLIDRLKLVLSAGLLASLAGVGHTQMHEGVTAIIHLSADGLHLLAAGAWLGGLLLLFYLVAMAVRTAAPERGIEAVNAATRFSGMGYIAVGTIIGSGLVNAWLLVGSFANLMRTPYGQLLSVKLCLFVGMLALAATNRFWLVPTLVRDGKLGQPGVALFRLRAHALGELALGFVIILIVAALGVMEPASNPPQ